MNNISRFNGCSNCGACLNICPTSAVAVDNGGLFYKVGVNEKKCVDCGRCVEVCPWNNERGVQNLSAAYGGFSKDKEIVAKSSSGGIFSAVADLILKKGGVVFGAVYSKDRHSVIFGSTDEFDLDEIRRSKYTESFVGNTFSEIKNILKTGRQVLFCGSPCQVAGLKRYLEKDYDNLLTCDFACGGFPSHRVFDDYLTELEKKYGSKTKSVNFRTKKFGWGRHGISITFENGKEYLSPAETDPYFRSFIYTHLINRENCFDCKFINNHYSDLVLADFWKYELSSLKNDFTGLSLILVNSKKGETVLKEFSQEVKLEPVDLHAASYNCRVKPSLTPEKAEKRKFFIKTLSEKGLRVAAVSAGMPSGGKAFYIRNKIRFVLFLRKIGIKKR